MPATTIQVPEEQESDALSRLEDRIQRAVALVLQLRQEKDSLTNKLNQTESSLAESRDENARLSDEIQTLKTERQQVRGRLEKLLDHIDQLGGAQ
ncbi:MAG TPA: cell division protein ZapB [Bryobacteraceae bacterium]|nr:cell division protein ZapB [Bryobacteraceae bacterium]